VIVAGMLRTRRTNPSTMGAKRTPNSREGARCNAAFHKSPLSLSHSRFDRLFSHRFDSRGLTVYSVMIWLQ
jgi:hypothetical protein